jgi:hypothetical protein
MRHYSGRNELNGFAKAVFIAWKSIVNTAIKIAIHPAVTNMHQPALIVYTKVYIHLFIVHYTIGVAITSGQKQF